MKKNLLTLLMGGAMLCASIFSNAQTSPGTTACTISNVSFSVNSLNSGSGSTCQVNMNLYFVAELTNDDQRFVTLNFWQRSSYPNVTYGTSAPGSDALGNVLATIVLEKDEDNANGWKLSDVYGADGVPVTTDGLQLLAFTAENYAGGLAAFYRRNVYFQVNGFVLPIEGACNTFQASNIAADVWGSTGTENDEIVCVSKDIALSNCEFATLPTIFGTLNCNNPAGYAITFNNSNNCRPFFVDYKVFLDVNGNGMRDSEDRQINEFDNDGDGIYDNVAILFPGQSTTTTMLRRVEDIGDNMLFVEGQIYTIDENGDTTTIQLESFEIDNTCNLTPVKFGLFTAQRNNQQVNLNWETAMEQNNKGFHVQRNTGSGWQTIAFVFSAADGGNSTQTLRYRYTDNNNFNGITQYRLLQEDFDGTAAYSEVKSVRGIAQAASVIVYPNPAVNGNVNLLFSDAGSRDVIVNDLSGRIVKTYREVAGNNLSISGLTTGFYTIKITDRKTATVTVEKVVVK